MPLFRFVCGATAVLCVPPADLPSLLLHEKPKQSRKTSTIEMDIMATEALADFVNTGVSSEREQSVSIVNEQPDKQPDKRVRKNRQRVVVRQPHRFLFCSSRR